jgi:hypothetical protein
MTVLQTNMNGAITLELLYEFADVGIAAMPTKKLPDHSPIAAGFL